MRKLLFFFAMVMSRFTILAVLLSFAAPVEGDIQIYNTGVDSSGTPLPDGTIGDPHYSLIQVPPESTTDIIVRTEPNYPIDPSSSSPWLLDDSLSAWIGPNNDYYTHSVEGDYIYRTTFSLPASVTVVISGQWSADNGGVDILLNGASTGNATSDPVVAFENWTPFTIQATGNQGINDLDFVVHNYPSSFPPYTTATGLRVEITSAIPEPSILVLLTIGFITLLAYTRRQRREA